MNCQTLVNLYIDWLKQKISVDNINGICEITTPFLDRHNDHVQIYIKEKNGGFIITDDGYTFNDLELGGFDITSERRKRILTTILNGFGVRRENNELIVETRPENFPQKKHNIIQAILSINDMFVLARPTIASLFKEDVERFLTTHEIRFLETISFTGKSGFVHHFDFAIPPSRSKPERIIRAINNPNRDNVTALIFSWADTRETRTPNSKAIGILNDSEKNVSFDLRSALEQYNIDPVLWSEREGYVDVLMN